MIYLIKREKIYVACCLVNLIYLSLLYIVRSVKGESSCYKGL